MVHVLTHVLAALGDLGPPLRGLFAVLNRQIVAKKIDATVPTKRKNGTITTIMVHVLTHVLAGLEDWGPSDWGPSLRGLFPFLNRQVVAAKKIDVQCNATAQLWYMY